VALVVVDPFVPELTDLDAWQRERRRKDRQVEILGEVFGKLRWQGAHGVSAARDECAGHEAGHANVYSVGIEARSERPLGFCQHLRQVADTSRRGVRSCSL
jgi:hypothetical protein